MQNEFAHSMKENFISKVWFIGDDLGDIPMLLKADVAVKMANSNNALNDYPFLTCPDNNSDGVAKFLLSYLKKKEGI